MAKTSSVQKNKRRERLSKLHAEKRAVLKGVVMDRTLPVEARFDASLTLAQLPRNRAANRVPLPCELTGRPRGNYRKFKLSRNMLRELANSGQIPGVTKASW